MQERGLSNRSYQRPTRCENPPEFRERHDHRRQLPSHNRAAGARPVPGRSAWGGEGTEEYSGDLRTAYAYRAGTLGSRPGGTPEEISRGQVRPSGRRPRNRCRVAPCPNGASKKMARGGDWWRKCYGEDAAKNFFDAPLGHGPLGGATGGHARCAGLPPANFLRSPSGTKSNALATSLWSADGDQGSAKSSRHPRILQSCSTERRNPNRSGARPVPGRAPLWRRLTASPPPPLAPLPAAAARADSPAVARR